MISAAAVDNVSYFLLQLTRPFAPRRQRQLCSVQRASRTLAKPIFMHGKSSCIIICACLYRFLTEFMIQMSQNTATEQQCGDSQLLSAPRYAIYDVAWKDVEETFPTNAQCNGRSPLWLRPTLCADTAAEQQCSDSRILPAYEMFDLAWTEDDEEVESMLQNFMTWASLTRDVEMQKQKGKVHSVLIVAIAFSAISHLSSKDHDELCEASNNDMPWEIQMCNVSPAALLCQVKLSSFLISSADP